MSAPHVYVLAPEAQAHIDEIGAYIAHDSLDAALKVYDAFEEAFGLLDPESRPLTIIPVLHSAHQEALACAPMARRRSATSKRGDASS